MTVDYKIYPQNWLSEIRPAILRRAGLDLDAGSEARCELCDVENHTTRGKRFPSQALPTLIVLTIAHLDQDIQNNDPTNLAALCQRCHLLHDRPHHLINASLTRDRNRKQTHFAMFNEREKREMMSTKGPNHSFNVLLSPHHMTLLEELAIKTSTNKSIIIRQSIANYHAMKVQGIPTCSDGQACRVPNMHPVPGQPQPASPGPPTPPELQMTTPR